METIDYTDAIGAGSPVVQVVCSPVQVAESCNSLPLPCFIVSECGGAYDVCRMVSRYEFLYVRVLQRQSRR